jgi:hypothetical protein
VAVRIKVLGSVVAFALLAVSVIWPRSAQANPHHSSFDTAPAPGASFAKPMVTTPALSCAASALAADGVAAIASAKISSVKTIPAGADGTPAYCEVRGVAERDVQFIVYLPLSWNGRIYMHGNGGFAGEALDAPLGHRARLKAVRLGFAAAFTNTGHDAASAPDGSWALNNPAREEDFGYRALTVTVNATQRIAARYYGLPPTRSYFDGCSTGGRAGFMSAQRYPADFDGILVGAPVFDMTTMLWKYWDNQQAIAATPLTTDHLQRLAAFILARYDGVDGLKDGVIADPDAIDFRPARDLPRQASDPAGFTDAEITALGRIYAPLTVGGQDVFPAMPVGSEPRGQQYAPDTQSLLPLQSAWVTRVVPDAQGKLGHPGLVATWFKYMAFEPDRPDLDWHTLDLARDFPRSQGAARVMNATDPDVSGFVERGGKMIIYHGWADFGVNPRRTIAYYNDASRRLGERGKTALKLYVVPGMFHCEGGLDVDHFDMMTPLIDWVESGKAPEDMTGARVDDGKTVRTRPVCAFPRRLKFLGQGDGNDASQFACVAPP